ncbi:MAG: hypothetical protein JNJ60_00385, partial [Rhodocyclaceae bacterium]|nr:hypothetical protein [Rhodocyclaceae bacterium]
LTRTDGKNWADQGFLEGHLIHIGGSLTVEGSFSAAPQYRVLKIDGTTMEVLGTPIASATGVTKNIWVQGPHGSLTMLHGGGNLPVQTIGDYQTKTFSGQNVLTRMDGRSWVDDGYRVDQLIQVGNEGETRKIIGFGDAQNFGVSKPNGAFATWGTGSVMILSGPAIASATLTGIDLHRSIPTRVEVQIAATLVVDTLSRASGSWIADGFAAGQVVYIEGLPGGFTIASVTATSLVLAGTAIQECVIEEGSLITVYRIDTKTDSGAEVGGDHFVVGLKPGAPANSVLAGPNSPLVIYGDTSQDGAWYSGHSYDRLGQEFGDKPFDPFPYLPDDQNEDNEFVFPLANPYDYAGHDIIDARNLFAGVSINNLPSVGFTAYGGMGNDLIYGSQAGDHLAGGSGEDEIHGQGGSDHIYGDSGVNVNILTRALTIPTIDASPAPSINPQLGASDQTFKPVKVGTPMRDDMVAGRDFLDGNGSANPDLPNVIFGDHGVITQYVDDPNLPPVLLQKIQTTDLSTILAIDSAQPQNGADDILFGTDIADILIGGAGNDMIDGRGADDLIFGDNVELTRMGGADGNLLDDILNARFQTLAGTLLYSRTDRALPTGIDPLYAYDATGPNSLNELTSGRLLTDGVKRNYRDPNGPQWWAEYQIDYAKYHTFAIDSGAEGVGSFGNDYLAGGAGNDTIFGQLGHDVIQGDGAIDLAVAATSHVGAGRKPMPLATDANGIDDPVGELFVVASFEAASDGQDYIEGGGGKDVVFGGLGQDDLVGGSSDFFSLTLPDNRPDDSDWITGGAGTQLARNNGFSATANTDGDNNNYGEDVVTVTDGTAFNSKHGRDSDAIVGDNGDIVRIVGVNHADVNPNPETNPNGQNYVTFNYDNYGGEKIVVRGIRLLDYTAGGPDSVPGDFFVPGLSTGTPAADMRQMFEVHCDPTTGIWTRFDIGGNDEVHGETGDDFIYLGGGSDIAFGDADSDDVIGGWGSDWISGGTGIDGILGDDGRIFTSRNTALSTGQVWGQAYAESLSGELRLLASDPDTRTSQGNVINELIHTPGNVQSELINVSGALKKSVDLTPFEVITGAELQVDVSADPMSHNPLFADDVIFGGLGVDFLHGGSGDDAISGAEAVGESYDIRFNSQGVAVGLARTDFSRPYNPGDILHFGDGDPHWNEPKPVQSRTGEFFLYNEYDPRRVILFTEATSANAIVWTGAVDADGTLPDISED